jgi:hypothetical protein
MRLFFIGSRGLTLTAGPHRRPGLLGRRSRGMIVALVKNKYRGKQS